MAPDGGPKSFGYHGCAVQAISPGNGGRGRESPFKRRSPRSHAKGLGSSGLLLHLVLHAIKSGCSGKGLSLDIETDG